MRLTRRVQAGMVLGVLLIVLVPPAVAQEYVVRPGDILEISVLGEPAVSGPATVSPDGKLTLHMAGDIQAAGLTLPQLTKKITEDLKEYVRDPQVTVSIRSSHRLYAYVLGQVAHPGAYEIDQGWRISQLVAVAGGPAREAALSRTLVMRSDKTIPVDLQQLMVDGNASANLSLEPGDVVIVPETRTRVVVMGGVQKPGQYAYNPGDRLVDLLSAAGGLTPKANMTDIGVIKRQGQKSAVNHVDLSKFYKTGDISQNVALQPEDIVYVPEKTGIDWVNLLGPLATLFLIFK